MHKHVSGRVVLALCVVAVSMMMLSCGSSSSSSSKTDGLIYNKTPYRAHLNFHSVKIVEVLPGQLLGEYDLKRGHSYLYQITIYDGAKVLEVIDHFIDIPSNPSSHNINGQRCHWFIEISGNRAPFQVVSAS